MNLEDIWTDIEADYAWRIDEIRFFQNQVSNLNSEGEQDQFRRAIVLLLYAHFEGFCKFSLSLYVNALNKESIKCKEVNYAIAAASLSNLFMELRNPDKKNDIFRKDLPDDAKLHRLARDREFLEKTFMFEEKVVIIPDNFIDTESNLKPIVLRKNLFKLGFQHDLFNHVEGKINKLISYRNGISHGEAKAGISLESYNELKEASLHIMTEIKSCIMDSLKNKSFLKS